MSDLKTSKIGMNLSAVFFIGLATLGYSTANASGIPEAYPVRVDESSINKMTDDETRGQAVYRVVVRSTYSNSCMAATRIIKQVYRAEDNRIDYQLFEYEPFLRVCTQIYEPFTRELLVDEFQWPSDSPLPEVTINGRYVY